MEQNHLRKVLNMEQKKETLITIYVQDIGI